MTNTATRRQRPITVIGATGKTGRRVVDRLRQLDLPVRSASRSSDVVFDWNDPATWSPALHNSGAVYVTYQPDLIVPRSAADMTAFVAAARDAGVDRLVLLSGRGEPEAKTCEDIVLTSGVTATVLRCSWFAQNFSEAFLADGVNEGAVVLPVGAVGEPFLDADDIADAAVEALTGDGHDGRVYELTGPRLLTFAEATAEIGRELGRDIAFIQVGLDEYRAGMAEAGVPDEYAEMVIALFGTLFDGRNSRTASGVRELLGRDAVDFGDVVKKAVAQGVWS
ncbi:NAD(P)H-binding protein [Williamsia sp. 1135]|uniref:NAD(P)H-binding protein n=1 Tax=Williamsia sp. 1135 TaxID=1889262 RepID=UPI000A10E1BE|nr:NAD(P)H-binding protein [Williamsia sp. 1135]ORM34157.1 NmrA family transcriptional regulator [Williamsia sp. 1135]